MALFHLSFRSRPSWSIYWVFTLCQAQYSVSQVQGEQHGLASVSLLYIRRRQIFESGKCQHSLWYKCYYMSSACSGIQVRIWRCQRKFQGCHGRDDMSTAQKTEEQLVWRQKELQKDGPLSVVFIVLYSGWWAKWWKLLSTILRSLEFTKKTLPNFLTCPVFPCIRVTA